MQNNTSMPESINFVETWKSLQETLKGIIKLEEVSLNAWKKSFDDIYYMCTAVPDPFVDELYEHTKLFLENHVLELLSIIQNEGNANLLQNYYTFWKTFSKGSEIIHSLYQYLNKNYIQREKLSDAEIIFGNLAPDPNERMEIRELCIDLWIKYIIIPLKESMSVLLLDEIDKQRDHKFLDMIACIIQSFIAVEEYKTKNTFSVYESCFEQPFLERNKNYFMCNAEKFLQECTVSQYLFKVLKIVRLKKFNSKTYLPIKTYNKLYDICCQSFISNHLEFLIHESKTIIKEERRRDMMNMYLVVTMIESGSISLVGVFQEHVQQCGLRVIESLEQKQIYVHFVEQLIVLYKKYKTMVVDVFNDNPCFIRAVDKAFELVINPTLVNNLPLNSAEYLSQYSDYLLKKSTTNSMTESDIDDKLIQAMTIFRFVGNKDLFQKFYQRHLATRLIYQQSQSIEREEDMISKLKVICGHEYTIKFHKMLVDINLSEELMKVFHNEFLKSESKLNINFSVNVLKTTIWPLTLLSVSSSFCIPKQLLPCVENFNMFYNKKSKAKKLTWLFRYSQGELKLNYLPKVYVVSMQTFQMAILLLFEDNNTLKYSEIHKLLGLTNDLFFQKHIKSLEKSKLLLIDGDIVSLNMAYHNKHTKARISTALQNDTPKEISSIYRFNEGDCKHYIQALIVRIMKSRKSLGHNQLISEIFTLSNKFKPSIAQIKRCIEFLIDKEYLERTPNSFDCYSYIA